MPCGCVASGPVGARHGSETGSVAGTWGPPTRRAGGARGPNAGGALKVARRERKRSRPALSKAERRQARPTAEPCLRNMAGRWPAGPSRLGHRLRRDVTRGRGPPAHRPRRAGESRTVARQSRRPSYEIPVDPRMNSSGSTRCRLSATRAGHRRAGATAWLSSCLGSVDDGYCSVSFLEVFAPKWLSGSARVAVA